MLKLCLNVLISVFVLMFSASMGLSAVYKCNFWGYNDSYTSASLLLDSESGLVRIISGSPYSEPKFKRISKAEISRSNSLFNWKVATSTGHHVPYAFQVDLIQLPGDYNARFIVVRFEGTTISTTHKQDGICRPINANVIDEYSEKTTQTVTQKLSKPDALEAGFLTQKAFDRRNIQMVLSDLGLYQLTIDGFYGNGTQRALKAYNEEYFSELDLTQKANVNALFKDILTPRDIEVEEPSPALGTLLNQIDDIVGGELEPSQVDQPEVNNDDGATQEEPQKSNLNAETAMQVQREMNRLGCNVGNADGVVGSLSREALISFNKAQGTSFGYDVYFDNQFLELLKTLDAEICKTKPDLEDEIIVKEFDNENFLSSLSNSIWTGDICGLKAEVRFSKDIEANYLRFKPICLETETQCNEGRYRIPFSDGLAYSYKTSDTFWWLHDPGVGQFISFLKIISKNRIEGTLRFKYCDVNLSRSE